MSKTLFLYKWSEVQFVETDGHEAFHPTPSQQPTLSVVYKYIRDFEASNVASIEDFVETLADALNEDTGIFEVERGKDSFTVSFYQDAYNHITYGNIVDKEKLESAIGNPVRRLSCEFKAEDFYVVVDATEKQFINGFKLKS